MCGVIIKSYFKMSLKKWTYFVLLSKEQIGASLISARSQSAQILISIKGISKYCHAWFYNQNIFQDIAEEMNLIYP